MMKTYPKLNTVVAGLAVFTMAAAHAAAADNLILNGDFELPGNTTDDGAWYNTAAVKDWNVIGNVDIVHRWWNPQSGYQSIDLNGNTPGSISQTIHVDKAGKYELSFYYAGNFYWGDAQNKPFTFSFTTDGTGTGQSLNGTHDPNTPPALVVWQHFDQKLDLLANQDYTIVFTSLATTPPPYGGPALDNVSLTAVPEPYQYGLASMFGLFGLAAYDRIRQRKLIR